MLRRQGFIVFTFASSIFPYTVFSMAKKKTANPSSKVIKARDVAADAGDDQSEDLMIARIQVHEKTIWMLESFLDT